MKSKLSGIYKIESILKPERCYVGSAVDITQRWGRHLSSLRNNRHHSTKLQRHFNEYGEGDLQFSVLVNCEKADLIENEQLFIDCLKPYFNICLTAGSQLGVICSAETRAKLSVSNTGKTHSAETRAKISAGNKGKIVSAETRAKQSAAASGEGNPSYGKPSPLRGISPSEETKEKLRIANTNPSAETRLKMSESAKNKPPVSDETRAKNSAAAIRTAKNRPPVSSETKKKQSESAKKRAKISEETRVKKSASAIAAWTRRRTL